VGDEIIVDPFDRVAQVRGHFRGTKAARFTSTPMISARAAQRHGGGQQPYTRQPHS
jgi:hypothetical protein